jgi:hypothetical protein
MPGDSGVTVVTVTAGAAVFSARQAAGASSARHSLRPFLKGQDVFRQTSRETRGEIAKLRLFEKLNP